MNDEDIVIKLEKLEHRIEALEAQITSNTTPSSLAKVKQKSLREFLNELRPASATDQGLCIAYFLENNKGCESFNTDDIKSSFREARIPVPKNPNDLINKNIAKGYIMDAEELKGSKKAWVLTGTGIESVEDR